MDSFKFYNILTVVSNLLFRSSRSLKLKRVTLEWSALIVYLRLCVDSIMFVLVICQIGITITATNFPHWSIEKVKHDQQLSRISARNIVEITLVCLF